MQLPAKVLLNEDSDGNGWLFFKSVMKNKQTSKNTPQSTLGHGSVNLQLHSTFSWDLPWATQKAAYPSSRKMLSSWKKVAAQDKEGGKTKQDLMTSGHSYVHILYSKGNESETSQHQQRRRNPSMVYSAGFPSSRETPCYRYLATTAEKKMLLL